MRKNIAQRTVAALLCAAVCFGLLAGCGNGSEQSSSSPTVEQTAPTESSYEVPEETCSAIRRELHEYFYGYDGNSTVSVSDYNGALDISLYYDGMVLRVPFPDYANALSIQSKELAAEYGEEIYKITVQFTGGQGKSIAWESYDGISGDLTDTYEETISLSDQTIDDLVERYGCMDWFYQLSESATQSDAPDSDEDAPPIGPVGGDGISTLDVTIGLLSSTIDGSVVYDPDANCIIEIISADGFVQSFLKSYAEDSASSAERWDTTKSNFCSLDKSTRKLINQSCNSEVDTMFAVADNEWEHEYVLIIQNGEVAYNLIDDFIDQHTP